MGSRLPWLLPNVSKILTRTRARCTEAPTVRPQRCWEQCLPTFCILGTSLLSPSCQSWAQQHHVQEDSQNPKQLPSHSSPTPGREKGFVRQFHAVGTLPRHLTEQLEFKTPRLGAPEGTGQPWALLHMETVLSYCVQFLGWWPLWPCQRVRQTAQCVPFLCPQGSAGGHLGPKRTALLARSWAHHLHPPQRGPGPLLELHFSSPLSTTQRSVILFPPGHHRPTPPGRPQLSAACQDSSPFQEPSGPRAVLLASSMVFLVCVGQYNF